MRKITAGKLSKILKEHNRWCDTDEDEGERANLSGADPELIEQVKDKYSHLLKKPKLVGV